MNITEANAVNVLMHALLGETDDMEAVGGAGMYLAERANKVLHAGLTEETWALRWERNLGKGKVGT
jgi:hypothetical protein